MIIYKFSLNVGRNAKVYLRFQDMKKARQLLQKAIAKENLQNSVVIRSYGYEKEEAIRPQQVVITYADGLTSSYLVWALEEMD